MIVNDKNNNEIYHECDILKIKTIKWIIFASTDMQPLII